ncbi:MAG: hypothetical protein V4507_17370 [Verrucomicrobiota bacterium]
MQEAKYWKQKYGSVENADLLDFVAHQLQVDAEDRLDQIYDIFKTHSFDYMAVIREGNLVGLCSRTQVSFIMGSRYGFSVMGKKKVSDHMLENPVCLIRGFVIREALSWVLSRTGARFYEDVVLSNESGEYLGIIPVPALVRLQTALMEEKYQLWDKLEEERASAAETIAPLLMGEKVFTS